MSYKNQQWIDSRFRSLAERKEDNRILSFIEKCDIPPQEMISFIRNTAPDALIYRISKSCRQRFSQTGNVVWKEAIDEADKRKARQGNRWALLNLLQSCLGKIQKENRDETRFLYLSEALGYARSFIEAFAHNDERGILSAQPYSILSAFLVHTAQSGEMRYTLQQIRAWRNAGLLSGHNGLLALSLPDLSDDEITGLSDEQLFAKTGVNTAYARHHLSNRLVRKEYWRSVRQGNQVKALTLAQYYYERKDYKTSFSLLRIIKDEPLQSAKSELLGLMYFYGLSVPKDFGKARSHLEGCLNDTIDPNPELVHALGEIYESTVSIKRAMELYKTILDNPHVLNNPFYEKITERFIWLERVYGLPDRVRMTVNITSRHRKCEFSVKIPAFCCVTVNWEKTKRISAAKIKSGDQYITFRHTYSSPGIYEINIEAQPLNAIESIEFSKYKNQLVDIRFERCKGLKQISLTGQSLPRLKLADSPYLIGLICRNNHIRYLDVRNAPMLNYLDCSYNPVEKVFGLPQTSIKYICMRGTKINRDEISRLLKLNDGKLCNSFLSDKTVKSDMRLEHYFRVTTWQQIRKYLKVNFSFYYWHNYTQCEKAYHVLKEMSQTPNSTPYKHGYLSVFDEYVSDDNIIRSEEFFLKEQIWSVSLATHVRAWRNRQPWMRYKPCCPAYFVCCCLVNMIENENEMKKYL